VLVNYFILQEEQVLMNAQLLNFSSLLYLDSIKKYQVGQQQIIPFDQLDSRPLFSLTKGEDIFIFDCGVSPEIS